MPSRPPASLVEGFQPKHRALWGHQPIRLRHRLEETGLFTDDALAALIDGYPRENYDLLSMAAQGTGNLAHWEEGELGPLDGPTALAAVKAGRLWLNLRRVHEASTPHAALLQQMFDALVACMPGFRPYKLNLGILISSPGAQVYYHADVPGQSLWHLRGRKRVYLYPNRAPFLPEDQVEKIVLGFTEAEINYHPWFEEYARSYDLEPGELLSWPLNAPHRVENLDGVNVSVTTEHWTTHIRNTYAVRYANGVIRNVLRLSPPPPTTSGARFWLRAAMAAGVKSSGLLRQQKMERWVRWQLDPASPDRMRPITPYLL